MIYTNAKITQSGLLLSHYAGQNPISNLIVSHSMPSTETILIDIYYTVSANTFYLIKNLSIPNGVSINIENSDLPYDNNQYSLYLDCQYESVENRENPVTVDCAISLSE